MSDFIREYPSSQQQTSQLKINHLEKSATSLDFYSIKKVSMIFRALNHKLRQEILRMIDKKGQASVSEIYVDMRLEQSVASQHIAILRRSGLIIPEREGKFMKYKLNAARIDMMNQMVVDLLK
jgi:DNA-binding transcriptional ArsR family regulator